MMKTRDGYDFGSISFDFGSISACLYNRMTKLFEYVKILRKFLMSPQSLKKEGQKTK